MDLTLYQFIHRKKKILGEGGGLRLKMMIVKDCIRLLLFFPIFHHVRKHKKKKQTLITEYSSRDRGVF